MCAKFHGSMYNSCRENSFGGGGKRFVMVDFSHFSSQIFKSLSLVFQPACSKSTFFAC